MNVNMCVILSHKSLKLFPFFIFFSFLILGDFHCSVCYFSNLSLYISANVFFIPSSVFFKKFSYCVLHLNLFMFIYLNKMFLYFIVSLLPGLPALYWNSWTYLHGEWFSRDQKQMMPNLLRASLELAEQHFCHIRLVRMSQKPRPGSRGGEVASTLDWSSRHIQGWENCWMPSRQTIHHIRCG